MVLVAEVEDWFIALDTAAAERVADAIDQLAEHGPNLGRPRVDRLTGSKVHNLKELRSRSIRVLFVFDESRQAVLLVAGDKRGQWKAWYQEAIPLAEARFAKWQTGGYANPPGDHQPPPDQQGGSAHE